MTASVEISLYPLKETYEDIIVEFIERLKLNKNIRVDVNGLSTQIFGEYDEIFALLQGEIQTVFEQHKAMVVIKMGPGERTPENLPEQLK